MVTAHWSAERLLSPREFEAYQGLEMLRLHSLGYSDHVGGGSGDTAGYLFVCDPLHFLRSLPSCRQLGRS
jgi:hypothetical protein